MAEQIFSPKFGILKFDGNEGGGVSTVGNEAYLYNFNFNGKDYVWVPESVINNGVITDETNAADGKIIGGNQYFFPTLMNKDTVKGLFQDGQGLDLAGTKYEDSIVQNKNSTKGILVPADKWNNLGIDSKINYYAIDENSQNKGPILGLGEHPEHTNQYTYFTRTQGGGSSSWIFNNEQGAPILRTRSYTVKKKGGVIGSAIRSVTKAVASVPLLPELALIASGGNPLVYASLKGAQTIGLGGSPSDVFKATAAAYISADLSTNPYVQSVGGSIVSTTTLANLGLQPATIALVQNAVGGAVVNAAYSGVMAGLTGGDIEKSMLAGAVGGAVGATGKEFASALVGGSENLTEIAKTLKITADEAAYVISGSFADGINASLRGTDFFTAFKDGLISKGVGVKVGDVVESTIKDKIGEDYMRQIVDASQQVSTVAARASLEGRDVGAAVENAMPGILVATVKAERQRQAESKRVAEQQRIDEQKRQIQEELKTIRTTIATGDVERDFQSAIDSANIEASQIYKDMSQVAAFPFAAAAGSVLINAAAAALAFIASRARELYPNDVQMQIKFVQESPVAQRALEQTKSTVTTIIDPKTNLSVAAVVPSADAPQDAKEALLTAEQMLEIKPRDVSAENYSTEIFKELVRMLEEKEQKEPLPPVEAGGTSPAIQKIMGDLQIAERQALANLNRAAQISKDADYRIQLYQDVLNSTDTEIRRLRDTMSLAQRFAEDPNFPEQAAEAADTIRLAQDEINQLENIGSQAQQELRDAQIARENARAAEEAFRQAQADAENERQAIISGRSQYYTMASEARYRQELDAFNKELADLEGKLAAAEQKRGQAETSSAARTAQRERIRASGRLVGPVEGMIEAELGGLQQQASESARQARSLATRKERLVAPQQETTEQRPISDEDIIRLLGLSRENAQRFGFMDDKGNIIGAEPGAQPGGTTTEPGAAGEGGEGEGAGTGEGAGVGEGEGEGEGAGLKPTRVSPVVIGEPRMRTVGEVTQTVSPRVTGEALASILGEKEPLFGGDEDEQRAVWNRRSLRLMRALGL